MTVTTRRVLYISFTIAFLLCAIVILLASAGFRFDWSRRTFYRYGLVSISAEPRPDRILVDNRERSISGDPLRVPSLTPGSHTIRLERAGYFPWERTFSLRSGEAIAEEHVRLFRQESAQTLADDAVLARVSSSERLIAVVRSVTPKLVLVDMEGRTTTLADTLDGAVADIAWSSNGETLFVASVENDATTLFALGLKGEELARVRVPGKAMKLLPWQDSRSEIVILRDGLLERVDFTTGQRQLLARDVLDATIQHRMLVFAEATGRILRLRSINDDPEATATVGRLSEARFVPSPSDTLTFLADGNRLFLVRLNSNPVRVSIFNDTTNASWGDENRFLLFGNDVGLSLLEIDQDDPVVLRRTSDPIGNMWWLEPPYYVLVKQATTLLLVDRFGRVDPIVVGFVSNGVRDLFVVRNGEAIVYIHGNALQLRRL